MKRLLIGSSGIAASALHLGLAAVVALAPSTAHALDQAARGQIMHGVVYLVAMQNQGGKLVPISRGSGTIISSSGIILTNRHVITDDNQRPMDAVAVGFTQDFDQAPKLTCLAYPAHSQISNDADLALIKCETNMQGGPLSATTYPSVVPIGDSSKLVPGDDVFIIGYPGIGGTTINWTAGKISGFIGENNEAGRSWIKTDAALAGGNSGGAAIDDQGRLIGIPTRIGDIEKRGTYQIGQVNYLRPVAFARDKFGDALASFDPRRTPRTPVAATPPVVVAEAPQVVPTPHAEPSVEPRSDEDDIQPEPISPPQRPVSPTPQPEPSAGGDDERPKPIPYEGVSFSGRTVDAATGRPVVGAVVVFLRPGIKIAQLRPDTIEESMFTKAISDGRGAFQSERPLPRGFTFGVIVVADRYSPIAVDDGVTTNNARVAPATDLGLLRLQRK